MQEQFYNTVAGDTWDLIAFKVFGQENLMTELLQANIQFANIVIFPGNVKLIIPKISKEAKEGKAPWL